MNKILCPIIVLMLFSKFCFAQLAIGWTSKDLSIQRFWRIVDSDLKEKMLIFNNDTILTKVFIRISEYVGNGLEGTMKNVFIRGAGVIGRFWEVPPHKYVIIDPPNLNVGGSSGFYFKFSEIKNDTTLRCGYLRPFDERPSMAKDSSMIYLTQSLDGLGNKSLNCWWELKSIIQKGGEKAAAKLVLGKFIDTLNNCRLKKILIFKWPDSVSQVSIFPINIVADGFIRDSVSSKDILHYWNSSLQYILSYTLKDEEFDSTGNKLYNISFRFKMPKVKKPEIIGTSVFVDEGFCRKEFDLRFIVFP
jgi:hypothetical protein